MADQEKSPAIAGGNNTDTLANSDPDSACSADDGDLEVGIEKSPEGMVELFSSSDSDSDSEEPENLGALSDPQKDKGQQLLDRISGLTDQIGRFTAQLELITANQDKYTEGIAALLKELQHHVLFPELNGSRWTVPAESGVRTDIAPAAPSASHGPLGRPEKPNRDGSQTSRKVKGSGSFEEQGQKSSEGQTVRKKRGRPRKNPLPESERPSVAKKPRRQTPSPDNDPATPKKRGRPKRNAST